jgi:undecaprenyl-diphosphatase
VAAAIVVVLGTAVWAGGTGRTRDAAIVAWFSHGPDWLEGPAGVIMTLGTRVGLLVVLPLAVLRFGRVTVAFELAAAALLAHAGATAGKEIVASARPGPSDGVTVRELVHDYGYPSAHAAVAFALATVWGWRSGTRERWCVVALATFVAVLRWYMGVHFVVDTIGGAALGLVVGAIAHEVARRLERVRVASGA